MGMELLRNERWDLEPPEGSIPGRGPGCPPTLPSSCVLQWGEHKTKPEELISEHQKVFCAYPLPTCSHWIEPSRWPHTFLSEEAVGACLPPSPCCLWGWKQSLGVRLKKKSSLKVWKGNYPSWCHTGLVDGLKQSCYVKGYSQSPILKSADHISNVYYNSPIVWVKYLKTTYMLLFILKWLQKRAKF